MIKTKIVIELNVTPEFKENELILFLKKQRENKEIKSYEITKNITQK